MSEHTNREIVRKAYAAAETGDIEAFLQQCDPKIEWVYPPMQGVPYGGVWTGFEGMKRFYEIYDEVEESLEYEATDFIAEGDRVVVLGRTRGKAKRSGRMVEYDWVDVVTLREDRIVKIRSHYDTTAVIEAHRADGPGAAGGGGGIGLEGRHDVGAGLRCPRTGGASQGRVALHRPSVRDRAVSPDARGAVTDPLRGGLPRPGAGRRGARDLRADSRLVHPRFR
ncbi:MAG: nuclear transport factor 2 family protein [Coriobacteriia bacterium]|nr:nuclear transport factor 2 family protein [Coriobacteriia bacterium]